ncbi:MAG: multidrug transporter [Gammaproteobacteria bacterium]
MKKLAILVLTAALSAPAFSAGEVDPRAAKPGAGAMLIDATLVRPLGVAATVLGAVTWVVSLPFSALGGNVGEAGKALVGAPARYTFRRPLGHNE